MKLTEKIKKVNIKVSSFLFIILVFVSIFTVSYVAANIMESNKKAFNTALVNSTYENMLQIIIVAEKINSDTGKIVNNIGDIRAGSQGIQLSTPHLKAKGVGSAAVWDYFVDKKTFKEWSDKNKNDTVLVLMGVNKDFCERFNSLFLATNKISPSKFVMNKNISMQCIGEGTAINPYSVVWVIEPDRVL